MVKQKHRARLALTGLVALVLAGCGSPSANSSLYSVHQPVVERSTFALDMTAGPDGFEQSELTRLNAWFEDLAAGRGDQVTVLSGAQEARHLGEIARVASRHGVVAEARSFGTDGAGDLAPGDVRVVVTRSRAHVPGCPNWSDKSTVALDNATSPGFGCAVNGNLAAMVADPEHLLAGVEAPATSLSMTPSKAIAAYRDAPPTGASGINATSSRETDQ